MRLSACIAAALLLLPSRPGTAQEPLPLSLLAVYRPLLEDALRSNPELQRLRALTEAERAKVPQAGALPDPELSLGVQRRAAMDVVVPNPVMPDMPLMGATPIGTEYSLMATQAFPWPGKRRGRTELAQAGVARAEAESQRARMDLEAQLQEGLAALLKVKAEQALLADQDSLWAEAEALARQCCELGTGTQADLLQAMMARARLAQRKLELEAQGDQQREALNRLAGRPPEAALELPEGLDRLPRPLPPPAAEARADARRRSPEWAQGQRDLQASSHALALGRMDLRPDLRVTAGAMKEPGMGTGWKAEVGMALPVFSGRKQGQAVVMRQAELGAARAAQAGLELTLDQSLAERLRTWSLSERQLKLYDEALLPQGELALRSLMGQYEGGRVTFQAVLDALNGRLKDRQARLDALARIHSLAVAQQRVALGRSSLATEGPEGGMGGSARPAAARGSAPAATAATLPAPKSSSMSM